MISRRQSLVFGGSALTLPMWTSARAAFTNRSATAAALDDSDLIYLTPLKSDGTESRCHAEIWYHFDGSDVWVVTDSQSWRARAVAQGLNKARLWVGEFGVWTQSGERYRSAPQIEARGSLISDPATHERVLDLFGGKYVMEWIVWGPRWRNALADGSRVMLRYQIAR